MIVLRYAGYNIKAILAGVIMNLKNACVEVCDSRSMHVRRTAFDEVGAQFYLLIVFLMSGSRAERWYFPTNLCP